MVSSLLFIFNQLVEVYITIPYLHAYLDDLLCPVIVMGLALWFFQKLLLQDDDFRFPFSFVVIFWVWYSLIFEVVFPQTDPRHFADLWDVVAYAAGSLLFYKFGNKPLRQKPQLV